MAILILMRHANAELASPGMRDFDRPLSPTGWKEASVTTERLLGLNLTPTRILCSPARRTVETLDAFQKQFALNDSIIEFHQELYAGDVTSYQSFIGGLEATDVSLFIGHNPMIEHFAFHLAESGKEADLHLLKTGYPTAGIAVFELGGATTSNHARGILSQFLTPLRH
ncbi:MAG: SixA phosphatase family protein [Notoacmeibacter sp.]